MSGILDLLDMVNVIDRLPGFLLGLKHGGAHVFTFDGAKITGQEVETMLTRRGVRVFGRRITSKHGMLAVPKAQADWAEYIMLRGGVPLVGKLRNRKNSGWAGQHTPGELPPAWKDRNEGGRQ